jgi:methionyl-tRNA synthetase
MEEISIEDLIKVDLRIGTVVSAERIEDSEKLLKLQVDIGEENPRQILAGMAKYYTPDGITGLQIVIVANLAPREMMGHTSEGMLLAAGEKPTLLGVTKQVKNGSRVK